MNPLIEQDIQAILADQSIDWQTLSDKRFLITGATGLVGQLLCRTLYSLNPSIKLFLSTRNKAQLEPLFPNAIIVEGNPQDLTIPDDSVDYLIHCASPTRSQFFVEKPVETIDAIVNGTQNLLKIAKRQSSLQKFIYLSSMEMYGTLDEEATENKQGFIDPLDVRSSYSLGKRVAELLCKSYQSEYGIPTVNVRLAMCFGPGIPANDNRVCKYCCDQAIAHNNIILKSDGQTVLNFCYTADAARGIFTLLQKGNNGEAYNLCNDHEGFNILKMAQTVASFSDVEVIVENTTKKTGFAPKNSMILSNEKIKALGWQPQNTTSEALKKTYDYLANQ